MITIPLFRRIPCQPALVAAALGWMQSAACAAISLVAGGSVTTPGSDNPGGTVIADFTTPFVGQGGLFSGTLRTLAVRLSGGTFDFYYQVTNTSSDPAEFIDGLVVSNFINFTTAVDWSTNGLAGITGAGAYSAGSTPSFSATRDLTPADDVTFFFPPGSLNNPGAGNPGAFLFVRTNALNYGPGQVVVSGAGFTAPIAAFGPAVPEPSTGLFGLTLLPFLLGRRRDSAEELAASVAKAEINL